jgi:hypothetical protein
VDLQTVNSVPPGLLDLVLDLLGAHDIGEEGVPGPQFWNELQGCLQEADGEEYFKDIAAFLNDPPYIERLMTELGRKPADDGEMLDSLACELGAATESEQDAPNEGSLDVEMAPAGEAVQVPAQEHAQEELVQEPVQDEPVQDAPNEGSLDVEMAPAGEAVQEPVQPVQEPAQPVQDEPVQSEPVQEDVWEAAANRATEEAAQRLQGRSLADGVESEEVTPGALSRRPRSEGEEGKGRDMLGANCRETRIELPRFSIGFAPLPDKPQDPSRNEGRVPPVLDRVRPRPR